MRPSGATAGAFAVRAGVCAVALAAAGAIFAAATGRDARVSIASALFIGAALLIVFNTIGEAGQRDRGVDARTGTAYPGFGSSPQGSFAWVLVGLALIGLGVLILVV